ncbi:MAG TPA: carbon monoxide dehydrogenase subunit G [bacterium]|nr:carbon monoxide dehydrogenase subunit G [bacterium]
MKVEGSYTFAAPRERVWTLLNDPAVLARATPGVKRLEPQGPDTYKATIEVAVGPVKGAYDGTVSITDKAPPERLTLRVEGGGRPGTIRATGELRLEEQDGQTVVHYVGDAQVTGIVASVGHRLMGGVARQMAGEFFKGIERELTRR